VDSLRCHACIRAHQSRSSSRGESDDEPIDSASVTVQDTTVYYHSCLLTQPVSTTSPSHSQMLDYEEGVLVGGVTVQHCCLLFLLSLYKYYLVLHNDKLWEHRLVPRDILEEVGQAGIVQYCCLLFRA